MHILAIDIGTSSLKAAVLEVATGHPVAEISHVPYPLHHPTPEAAEIQPEELWACFCEAARKAVWSAASLTVKISGVGLSCLTPALVLLDKTGNPVTPIWTHLDRRSRPAARQVWRTAGKDFLHTTGNLPLPGGITAVALRQMMNDDPYLLHEIHSYLHLNGWLGFRMTGEKAFDPANASFSGLYATMTTKTWSPEWCAFFEVDLRWLPPIIEGNTTIGLLRSEVAAEMGLPAGLPVKIGTADTSSAMLAAGMRDGDLMHVVGTTQVLAVFVINPIPSPARLTRDFGIGTKMVQVVHNPVSGAALDWMHRLCFRDQTSREFFDRTIAAARDLSTGVTLDPPYLGGDRHLMEAHRAAFRDLTTATDRMELLAALLQEMVRRHREALRALEKNGPFRQVFLTGGGAEVVKQLIPEYQNASVQVLEESSLRGIARLFSTESG